MARAVVVKLGGSVITDKSKPYSYRSDVVSALAEEIASSDEMVVAVHGGGSFGHTVARQYGLSSESVSPTALGVSQTRSAMYELNHLVCKTMTECKLSPYSFAPFDILSRSGKGVASSWLRSLLSARLTPLTFGDVSIAKGGFRVLSGDTIAYELVRILRPKRCVFALDVDGVYEADTRVIVPELSPSKARRIKVPKSEDATGGIGGKLDVAARMAAIGTSACFVSGYRRNEFSKALKGLEFYGTVVRS